VRISFRIAVTLATAAVIAPAAFAAGPTATTAAPTVQTTPQPAPQGSAFGPLQGLGTNAQPAETTVTTKRASDSDNGRGTLLFLSLVSIILIFAVVGFIWYEGRTTRAEAKRRQRMRSGRTPQPATAGEGRRGPPPPPRKRRAQAKRKKR
jgi:flagellar basal body-associated protein FliL